MSDQWNVNKVIVRRWPSPLEVALEKIRRPVPVVSTSKEQKK